MDHKYSFQIEWSEEDQEYLATCPAFPGLSAFGETEEEALSEAKVALQGFIEVYKDKNFELPEPHFRETHSGQFRVRLPKSLHRQAASLAASDNISLNQLVVGAVEQRVGFKRAGTQMLNELKQALAEQASRIQVVVASALTANERVTTEETVSKTSSHTRTRTLLIGANTGQVH